MTILFCNKALFCINCIRLYRFKHNLIDKWDILKTPSAYAPEIRSKSFQMKKVRLWPYFSWSLLKCTSMMQHHIKNFNPISLINWKTSKFTVQHVFSIWNKIPLSILLHAINVERNKMQLHSIMYKYCSEYYFICTII